MASSPPQGEAWVSLTRTAWDFDPCLALELRSRSAASCMVPACHSCMVCSSMVGQRLISTWIQMFSAQI